jgi:hypothetical protein
MKHFLQVASLGLAVADPSHHLGAVAQDVVAGRTVFVMGQQGQQPVVAGQGGLVGKEFAGAAGGAG